MLAPAVQGSVVAEAGNSSIPLETVNRAVLVNTSEQATTAAATVKVSIVAVLDSLAGGSVICKPQTVFVSSDIPIDMSVSDRLKTKIWSHEYVDFRLLLNIKKEHASFHLCLSNDTSSSPGQPIITLEPNKQTRNINFMEM